MTQGCVYPSPVSPALLADISAVLKETSESIGVTLDSYALMYQAVSIYNAVQQFGLYDENEQFLAAERLVVSRCEAMRPDKGKIH